jgi:thiamine transport system ATP-binding protein
MLRLVEVSVSYGATPALVQVDLELGAGERLALLGPSGSGKSTLLRAIAGLEPLAGGRVEWAGQDLAGVPVHRRGFGLMFQDYVLFPHRDVAGNVAFGLEMHDVAPAARAMRVHEVLELVGLRGYERRRTDQLSGGEQQRVALARALAPTPRVLMLDEPLGALDRALRARLLEDLAGLFAELALPIIYVTHDQEEALALGDRVAVINAGRLETVLPARELWRSPPNEFVARFLGLSNIIPLRLAADGAAVTPWGAVPLAAPPPTGATKLLLRPDALAIAAHGPLGGVVAAATFRGDLTSVQVRPAADEGPLLEVRLRGADALEVGRPVRLSVDRAGVLFLP